MSQLIRPDSIKLNVWSIKLQDANVISIHPVDVKYSTFNVIPDAGVDIPTYIVLNFLYEPIYINDVIPDNIVNPAANIDAEL